MNFRQYMILGAITVCSTLGDVFLKMGMNQVGSVRLAHLLRLLLAVANPWIILGILTLLGFFVAYISSLSWADLTFVMPATAFGYVLTALMARFFLHEHVTVWRWTGVGMITLAIGFVTGGPSVTESKPGARAAETRP